MRPKYVSAGTSFAIAAERSWLRSIASAACEASSDGVQSRQSELIGRLLSSIAIFSPASQMPPVGCSVIAASAACSSRIDLRVARAVRVQLGDQTGFFRDGPAFQRLAHGEERPQISHRGDSEIALSGDAFRKFACRLPRCHGGNRASPRPDGFRCRPVRPSTTENPTDARTNSRRFRSRRRTRRAGFQRRKAQRRRKATRREFLSP